MSSVLSPFGNSAANRKGLKMMTVSSCNADGMTELCLRIGQQVFFRLELNYAYYTFKFSLSSAVKKNFFNHILNAHQLTNEQEEEKTGKVLFIDRAYPWPEQ